MTLPDFSVLLLAWNDADPRVAVLGGAALPPTLPLVYRLAAQQPVLAVYPHLPAETDEDRQPPAAPGTAGASKKPIAPRPAAPTEAPAAPGVRSLPVPVPPKTSPSQRQSQIIGLDELLPVAPALQPTALQAATPSAPARRQWPQEVRAAPVGQWQAPAAPYVGAADNEMPPPAPGPVPPRATGSAADLPRARTVNPTNATAPTAGVALRPPLHPLAGDLNFDPDPELPRITRPAASGETGGEPGPAEAAALSAPEDDLTPEAPAPPAAGAGPPTTAQAPKPQEAVPPPAVLVPALDGLNFRMIQYARQAAQLVRGRADFRVIYAPSWPAWLAALEIRNSSGRPLVLYTARLAVDFNAAAECGWLLEIERMALRRARLILVPTAELRQRLCAQYGATIGEVRVVPAANETAVRDTLAEVAAG